jgi:hypothetical protein
MADGSATFMIDVDASQSAKSADEAANAIEALNDQLKIERELFKALKAAGAPEEAKRHQMAIAELKAEMSKETVALVRHGKTIGMVRAERKATAKAADAEAAKAAAQSKAASMISKSQMSAQREHSKALGEFARELTNATGTSKLMSIATMGTAAAAVAATAAIVGATVALGAYIIKSADARRSELLRLEGLTKMRSMWGIAAGNAGDLQAAIDRVSGSSAISRQQVAGYAEQLYKAGMRGGNLVEALDAMSIKASTQGEDAAQMFAGWATGAALAGQSVKGLADRVRGQLGGVARKQMLSLDVQWMKFKENIQSIGKAFNIEGMLRGLNTVLSMFREGQAVGDAWRAILQAIFGPIFGKGEMGGLAIKRVIQGATVAILKMGTSALNTSAAIGEMMPDWVKRKWVDFNYILKDTGLIVEGIAAGFAYLQFAVNPILRLAVVFGAVSTAASKAGATIKQVWNDLTNFGWGNLGSMMVDGLVDGLKNGVSRVVGAVTDLGAAAKNALKDALGIHSPSRVFAELGAFTAQGFEQGVERGTPRAQTAMDRLASPDRASSYTATTTNSSRSVVIESLVVQGGSQGAAVAVRDELARILEGVALEMGGARV